MNYTVVEFNDLFNFQKQVNTKIREGCMLKGGVSTTRTERGMNYAQALRCPPAPGAAALEAAAASKRSRAPPPPENNGFEGGGKRYTKSSKNRRGKMTRRH